VEQVEEEKGLISVQHAQAHPSFAEAVEDGVEEAGVPKKKLCDDCEPVGCAGEGSGGFVVEEVATFEGTPK